ncbi:MAG: hypothetical protein PHS31_10610 [Victivallaceae bacterium]|nr:hypothetical protein [Victivallaceae bacterium]
MNKRSAKIKHILIPVAIFLPLLATLAIISLATTREPLSPKDILAKKEWKPAELRDCLSRTMQLKTDREQRREVTKHLRDEIAKLPKTEQTQIRTAALKDAMEKSLEQLRVLPEEERANIIDKMKTQATRNYERIGNMSQSEKDKIRERHSSAEAKAATNEMNKIFTAKMTPEERNEFWPIVEIWLKTMREI